MKNKIIDKEQIYPLLHDGMTIMTGGYASVGVPDTLIDAVIESGVRNLTIISNDSGYPGRGVSKLVAERQVSKIITSHIGRNPQTGQLGKEGDLEIVLTPQGTLAEQIRTGGAGLGAVVTPVGLGTEVAAGKQILVLNGYEYLIEMPLRADLALIRGSVVDTFGNIFYHGTARNFNPLMAMAADVVIVDAERIVEIGDIDNDMIMTSGIFVDYIVQGYTHALERDH